MKTDARPSNPPPERPRVLVFIRYYLPGFRGGGPTVSVANFVEYLSSEFDFWIVTANHDYKHPQPYENWGSKSWRQIGSAMVKYVDERSMNTGIMRQVFRESHPDWVHLNSFFDPIFTLRPLMWCLVYRKYRQHVIVAPRGELNQGALGLKALKKRLYILLIRGLGIHRRVRWHATSKPEVESIGNELGAAATVFLAPNLVSKSNAVENERGIAVGPPISVVFLSRVSPMKNLHGALDVLHKSAIDFSLDIYGPIEDHKYWSHCQEYIEQYGLGGRVHYLGELHHDQVQETLSQYQVFFLPSLGENHGHVIYEALSSGCYVVTSDRVPWAILDDSEAGVRTALEDPDATVAVFRKLSLYDQSQWLRARSAAHDIARDFSDSPPLSAYTAMWSA